MTAPMLLFYSGRKDYWNFYDLVNKKVLNFQVNVPRKRLIGSSKGWLIFTEKNTVDKTFGVTLVNPLFRVRGREKKENSLIRLPPLTPPGWKKWYKDCERFVCKATISADPILNAHDCIVTVIHLERCTLAFIRLGKDTTWTYVNESVDNARLGCHMVEEAASLGNKFYAVNSWSEVLFFDVSTWSNSNIKLVGRGNRPDDDDDDIKRYIFEGEGNKLWMVQRYLEFGEVKRVTKKFRVFELNYQAGEWTEKNTLGDFAVFVGDNFSVCVLAAKLLGFQSNCIYFNHDRDYVGYYYEAYDFGVYNVEDQCFEEIYTESVEKLLEMSYPLPIWVMPALCF
ncbi:hypothetical protein RchiOBHm_Chr2g0108331 [Rosa chinensis]|uniref:KIB1-4 beta-propeller domain-containing protein n=1 Tax=Rosa chinensis TaxID=74649 RepID=A0A2P6RP61_ROSCH|nr:putative F-box protein At5g55150 [Rosa chinensis]PRQ48226.1 hypothetical protein RchiOBHm_Chr2g0108331 [Rosa chinensis]